MRASGPVLTALFWVAFCSPKGERNKENRERALTLVWWLKEVPKETPLKQRSGEVAEISASAAAAAQLLPSVFLLCFVLPGGGRRWRLVFLQVLLPLLLLGFPGRLAGRSRGREGTFSQVYL